MSSDDVKITERGDGALSVRSAGNGGSIIYPVEVAALRARFAAERMPEDVQNLVEEARDWPRHGGDNFCGVCAGPCGGWPDEPVGDQDGLVKRLAAALEADYSQKGADDDPS